MRPVTVVLAGALACTLWAETAQAEFRRCNYLLELGASLYVNQHLQLSRSTQGNGGADAAVWDNLSRDTYDKAWRGWWNLDHDNPAVWISAATTNHAFNGGLPDGFSLVHKHNALAPGVAGSVRTFTFFSLVTEVDLQVRGGTVTNPSGGMPITPMSCAANGFTQGGTVVHELGHAYGYDHWLDWISIMNPSHFDVLSCERRRNDDGPDPDTLDDTSMPLTPDALSTQCHDLHYGIRSGVDVSGTAIRQTCALGHGQNCATALDTLRHIPREDTSALVLATFTTFSNRDSIAGDVAYRLVLSRDQFLGSGDREIARGTLSNWSAGATVTRIVGANMNPAVAMPVVGAEYQLLVQLDPDNLIAETTELDNVIDTRIRFVRD